VLEGAPDGVWGAEMVMGGLALGAALFMAAGAGLHVETGTPAALCPDVAEVRRAVRDRLNIEGEGEWLASYELVHRPQSEAGDIVRLELRDPAGRLRLRRELPRSGAACVALAQAVAMVLEGYFRHPGEPLDEAATPTAPMPAANPPAARVQTTGGPPARETPPAPRAPGRGLVAAVTGAWSAGPSSPAVALGLSYGRSARWAVGIQAAWLTREQASRIDLQPGEATGVLRSTLFQTWGAIRLGAARPIELLVGPELALAIDRLRTMDVPEGRANVRAAVGAGARGELRIWVAPRAALSFVAAADYSPRFWAGHFAIEGVGTEPFPAPTARLLLGVSLAVLAFP
jgi:hypothetical protein